jgi:hypothetical protein
LYCLGATKDCFCRFLTVPCSFCKVFVGVHLFYFSFNHCQSVGRTTDCKTRKFK